MIVGYIFNFIYKKYKKEMRSTGARGHTGRVSVRGRGGANKINYRLFDIYRRVNRYGVLVRVFYDPNRTCKLGLIMYENSVSGLILVQRNVRLGDLLYFGTNKVSDDNEIKNGYSMPLLNMPLFSVLSNIEFKPFKGGGLCRSAETSCVLVGKAKNLGILKLNSKWELRLPLACMASYGSMSSRLFNNIYIKKSR